MRLRRTTPSARDAGILARGSERTATSRASSIPTRANSALMTGMAPTAWLDSSKPSDPMVSPIVTCIRSSCSLTSLSDSLIYCPIACKHLRTEVPAMTTRLERYEPVSYTHLRAHETVLDLVCRLLLEK